MVELKPALTWRQARQLHYAGRILGVFSLPLAERIIDKQTLNLLSRDPAFAVLEPSKKAKVLSGALSEVKSAAAVNPGKYDGSGFARGLLRLMVLSAGTLAFYGLQALVNVASGMSYGVNDPLLMLGVLVGWTAVMVGITGVALAELRGLAKKSYQALAGSITEAPKSLIRSE